MPFYLKTAVDAMLQEHYDTVSLVVMGKSQSPSCNEGEIQS
jgi:hypothetical protein